MSENVKITIIENLNSSSNIIVIDTETKYFERKESFIEDLYNGV